MLQPQVYVQFGVEVGVCWSNDGGHDRSGSLEILVLSHSFSFPRTFAESRFTLRNLDRGCEYASSQAVHSKVHQRFLNRYTLSQETIVQQLQSAMASQLKVPEIFKTFFE